MRAGKWTLLIAAIPILLIGCKKTAPAPADSAAAPLAAKFDPDLARKQIIIADSVYIHSMQNKDPNPAMAYYSTDAVSMSEGAKMVQGPDSIREAFVQASDANPRNFNFKVDAVKFSDDGTMATDYGSYSGTVDGPAGKPIKTAGHYMNVWRRVKGGWQLIAEINNSSPVSL